MGLAGRGSISMGLVLLGSQEGPSGLGGLEALEGQVSIISANLLRTLNYR